MSDTAPTPVVKPRRFSPLLLVAGLICLAISGSVLFGSDPFEAITSLPLGWIAIVGAMVVGAALALAPTRRK